MRATANATITFGLVTFPVKVYAATAAEKTIKFKQLCGACSTPPKQQYHCEQCNTNVPRGQMSKGYEFAKGQYLVFSPEEIKDLQEESSKIIEVAEFVDADSIDPTYYSKPYYLGTDKAGSKAYAIFRAAMQNEQHQARESNL